MSAVTSGPALTIGSPASRPAPGGWLGRTVALLAAGAQVVAVFLPWDPRAAALDLTLRRFDVGVAQPTVGAVLVALAALPAIAALMTDAGWPRLVSALGTGALVLTWIARGPEGQITIGVAVALGAAVAHLVAAAVARGPAVPRPTPRRPSGTRPERLRMRGAERRAHVTMLEATMDDDHGHDGRTHRQDGRAYGHREIDHTADTAFEAWGPNRAACFGEAVRALVASFADTTDVRATDRHDVDLAPGADDEDLLVDLLDEVIYLLDVRGVVPVGGRIRDRDDGGITGHLDVVDTSEVRPSGAVPKAITYHGLEVTADEDGWRCRVTVDV